MRTTSGLLRRFAAIGVVVTAIDVGLFVGLVAGAELPFVAADAIAIAVAATVSWLAHRAITFADDPAVRWVRYPSAFAVTALAAMAVDVGVLALGWMVVDPAGAVGWLAVKVPAVAAAGLFRSRVYRAVLFAAVQSEQQVHGRRGPAPGDVRLSVVVPAYREQGRIAVTVQRLRAELGPLVGATDLEVVVVDDGSGDGTADEARAAGADAVVVQPVNRGKGAAVRAGVLVARGRTVAFTDADLAYAPDQIARLLAEVERGWDVVVGSRRHTDTTTVVRAGRLREAGGRVINRFTHLVLLGQYRDTQCGLKAFRSDIARLLFGKARVDGFAFDVEVFHLVERYHLSLTEVPVTVENSTRSTVHVVRDGSRLVSDLLRIVRWGRQGRYDLDGPEAAALSEAGGAAG